MSSSNNIYETLDVIGQVLIRCFIMGILVLFFWWGALALAGDLVYSVHTKLVVSISRQQFNAIQYAGGLMTKLVIFVFFLFPYIAIRLVIGKRGLGT
ncbi:MAG: DUF6868 family protein [bacterium]